MNIRQLLVGTVLLLLALPMPGVVAGHEPKFRPLLDGKSLQGWHIIGGGEWTVEDGVLHGKNVVSEPKHGHLVTDQQYGDFTARLKYKSIAGNSGFYFRIEKVPGDVGVKGFQAEIDAANDIGGLYETNGRAWVVKPTAEQVKKYFKPGDWNEMTVVAKGGDITVTVNGTVTAQLKNDPGRKTGYLALQLHGGQDCEALFKDLEISGEPVK